MDLVAYVDGKPSWEEHHYYAIETAMKQVIRKHDLPIEWGYDKWSWDMPHWQITTFNNQDARDIYDIRNIM